MIRVLLADDQASFRDGLRELFATVDGVEIAGEAADGADAVEQARRSRPDVVLMDIRMPGMDGIAATRALRAQNPATCVLMLTTFDEDELVAGAIRAGAMGYLLKGTPIDDIVSILHLALRGYTAIGRGVAPAQRRGTGADAEIDEALCRSERLTAREREIWELIGQGLTNREVASRLSLTEGRFETTSLRCWGRSAFGTARKPRCYAGNGSATDHCRGVGARTAPSSSPPLLGR